MPRAMKNLFCTKHYEGPLDVWYDCEVCCQGSKEEALQHMQWLSKRASKRLFIKSQSVAQALYRGTSAENSPTHRPSRGKARSDPPEEKNP